jgi:hypothetical protein
MQALLYRRGGVRAPKGWLGRVHGWRGWRGWDTDRFSGEAGLETMVGLTDSDGDAIVEKEACFLEV